MTDAELLEMVVMNLNLQDEMLDEEALTARNKLIQFYISSAKRRIKTEGADVSKDGASDLIVQYASWLYNCRNASVKMPPNVRYTLNNTFLSDHFEESEQ